MTATPLCVRAPVSIQGTPCPHPHLRDLPEVSESLPLNRDPCAQALHDPSGKQYCILECTPSVDSPNGKDAQCGTATCKPIQGVGVCTYDD